MGLDTTHDCWHGSYGGFGIFRETVGRAAGLPYVVDPSYGNRHRANIEWDQYPLEAYQGRWRKVRPTWVQPEDVYGVPVQDDVLYLIVHSDCDGELRRGYLPRLVRRLIELEPRFDELAGDYEAGALRQFIEGLELAIRQGEHVRFG